jgi:hypothetical protein
MTDKTLDKVQSAIIEVIGTEPKKLMLIHEGMKAKGFDLPMTTLRDRITTLIKWETLVCDSVEAGTGAKLYAVAGSNEAKPATAAKKKKATKKNKVAPKLKPAKAPAKKTPEKKEPVATEQPTAAPPQEDPQQKQKRKKIGRTLDPEKLTDIKKGDLISWKIVRGEGKGRVAQGVVLGTHEWLRQLSFDTLHPVTNKWARVNIKYATLVARSGDFDPENYEKFVGEVPA